MVCPNRPQSPSRWESPILRIPFDHPKFLPPPRKSRVGFSAKSAHRKPGAFLPLPRNGVPMPCQRIAWERSFLEWKNGDRGTKRTHVGASTQLRFAQLAGSSHRQEKPDYRGTVPCSRHTAEGTVLNNAASRCLRFQIRPLSQNEKHMSH